MVLFRRKNKTRKSLSTARPRKFIRRLPLSLEVLESRILLSADNWIASSGNWDVGSNWSLGQAPGAGDTAVINTSSAATITIQSGDNINVQNVTTGSNDTLSITGGSLTVTSGTSTLSGALSMSGGSVTATGSGVSLTADGSTTVAGASLDASGGAALSLPNLTSYSGSTYSYYSSTTFAATGTGSKLSLGALSTVNLTTNGTTWDVNATQGGEVDLSQLATVSVTGTDAVGAQFTADGAGSQIDISSLTSLSGSKVSSLKVSNNGTILDGKLTTLDDVAVSLDGTGTLATSQWASVTNFSSITVTGGSYSLSGITDFDGSSLSVSGGAVLSLPNLTSYSGSTYSYYSSTTFAATGTGSKLSLGALSTVNLTTNGTTWDVNATQGGEVDLSQLATVSVTGTDAVGAQFTADGAGSQIDISSLTSLSGSKVSSLKVSNNGTILDGKLTTLTDVGITLDGSDLDIGDSWTSLAGGNLTITAGSYTLPDLTNFANATIQLSGGASLNLPVLTTGNIVLGNGTSVTIQGAVVAMPADKTSGATINIPTSKGLTVTLQNSGTLTDTTINVGSGTNVVLAGGTYLGTTTFNVAQGATVDLTGGGSTNYGGTLTGSGAGTVGFSGGQLDATTGGLTLNFPGSIFQWTGGGFNTALGNLTNLGTITLAGSSDKVVYNDGSLDNKGTIIQTGSGNLGLHSDNVSPTTLINEAGAYYLIESDSGIDNPSGGQVAVQNAGTIEKTAGTGTSTLDINGPLSNTGTIEADSGTLSLDANSITQLANNALSAGTWNALNGATLKFPSGTSVTTNEANVSLIGSGASITALAGLATNSGTLTIGSGAVLNLSGNFTQTAAGTLSDQIDSTLGGGQLAISGTATLDGNFNVNLLNGFNPSRNAVYPVMTYASFSGSFANVTGLGSSLTEQLNPTSLDLVNGTGAPVALQLSQVTAPTTATTGQQITVNWQVSNSGSTAASGNWQDSVYLSTTPAITGSSVLLGSVTHSGGLAANGSYNASLTAAVPALPPGNYYVLVETDSLDQVLVIDRTKDILAVSTGQLAVSVPALTLGTPANGTFTAADQDQYYQVTVPAGGSLQVSLTSAASSGALALYVSQGTQPTPYSFQESANLAGQPNQSLNVPVTGAGTYYILVHSVSGAAAAAGYTLSVSQTNALTVSAPSSSYTGGNGGNLTLDIKGTNFSSNTTASLSLGSTTIQAATIYFQSASEIYATFNLTGVATGNYTLTVQNGTENATAPTTVAVVPASSGNPVQLALATPSLVSAGRDGIVTVTVTNTSNNDVLAPLLFLTTDGATLKLPSQSGFQGATLNFLAISQTGPAGILLPGESVQVQIQFQSTTTNPTINFQLYQAEDSQPMDWASAKSSLQGNIPTDAWNAIWSNFLANVGSTVGSYHTVLANDATYLGQLGEYGNDVNTLLDFELDKAADDFITPTLTTVTDVSFPAPGLPLTFVRTFQQPIDRRSTPGPLGLGWTDNWQISLSTDAQGNVTITDNGQQRYFTLRADGSYQPGPGDFATLTLANGIYQLKDPDGMLLVFNADGTLNYQQDTNGNRITCGYTNGQLTSLTSSDGQTITITYNTQGLINQVTAPDGQLTTYAYDSNQHLVSYTDQYGTTNYTYLSGQSSPAQINALSEIAYADNTHLFFSYDSQGRLIDQHRDNGQEDISYSYLPVNGYIATDGDGNKTTYLIDNAGNVCQVIDPLGNVTKYTYDDNGNVTQAAAPQGVTYSYSYDAKGNLISETDALGNTTTFTYDPNNNLTSYTDAKGHTTTYRYDGNNNLLSITYADGSKQQYSYNPLGEATQFLNARGDAIGYTYNTQGQILTESFADGTSFTYTYDSHGNLTSATDAQGKVTTFVYGDANNPDLLTEVEYPDGTYLKFQYNIAGQRTQSVDQTGFTVNYTYDALGRLSKLTDGNNNLIVQYTYDSAGNLIQKDMGNGTRTVYTYDAADEVLSITNYAPDHTTVNSFDKYTYDALGNVLTDTNQDGQWVYTYDADSQLVQAVFTPNSSDPDGLTAQNLQYVYDAAGNRISETVNGVTTT
jgi:YD repeat-containing protein